LLTTVFSHCPSGSRFFGPVPACCRYKLRPWALASRSVSPMNRSVGGCRGKGLPLSSTQTRYLVTAASPLSMAPRDPTLDWLYQSGWVPNLFMPPLSFAVASVSPLPPFFSRPTAVFFPRETA